MMGPKFRLGLAALTKPDHTFAQQYDRGNNIQRQVDSWPLWYAKIPFQRFSTSCNTVTCWSAGWRNNNSPETPTRPSLTFGAGGRTRTGRRRLAVDWSKARPMKIRVSQCSHRHNTDINHERQMDAKEWDRLANVCVVRATTALQQDTSGYNKGQRDHISDMFNSMAATNRGIRRLLDLGWGAPSAVDALALARLQLEGLYALCLMFEGSRGKCLFAPGSILTALGTMSNFTGKATYRELAD